MQKTRSRRKKLELALQKASDWLDAIEDTPEKINEHIYFGPHKWIVCLLGSSIYTVRNYIDDNKNKLK